ncbi:hypothetical protein F66182_4749 [Fusarium sp. NRRL 66182]|nr:hypothetical protein F66182_4749 [Fusarium sp. NRRL 66182]
MAEQLSTPRITAAYLDNFVGRVVMLVGKVTQLRGDQATLDSEGTVTVLLNRDAHLSNGNAVQVIGKVNPDLSIKVLTSRDLGSGVVLALGSTPSTATIKSLKLLHNAYAAAQRLQRTTRSSSGQSRPTTAMSFTTSSSNVVLGHEPQSRSPSPSYPSHISQTPTPSLGTLLPSPPEQDIPYRSYPTETSRCSSVNPQPNHRSLSKSQHTCDQQSSQPSLIPSAQPYTSLTYSPPSLSSPSLLPSPPMTQPRDDSFRSSLGPPMSPAVSTSSQHRPVSVGRRFSILSTGAATVNANSKLDNLSESALFDAVLDGIGRIHVAMGRDDAGRWRIKREPDERS